VVQDDVFSLGSKSSVRVAVPREAEWTLAPLVVATTWHDHSGARAATALPLGGARLRCGARSLRIARSTARVSEDWDQSRLLGDLHPFSIRLVPRPWMHPEESRGHD